MYKKQKGKKKKTQTNKKESVKRRSNNKKEAQKCTKNKRIKTKAENKDFNGSISMKRSRELVAHLAYFLHKIQHFSNSRFTTI